MFFNVNHFRLNLVALSVMNQGSKRQNLTAHNYNQNHVDSNSTSINSINSIGSADLSFSVYIIPVVCMLLCLTYWIIDLSCDSDAKKRREEVDNYVSLYKIHNFNDDYF